MTKSKNPLWNLIWNFKAQENKRFRSDKIFIQHEFQLKLFLSLLNLLYSCAFNSEQGIYFPLTISMMILGMSVLSLNDENFSAPTPTA